MESILRTTPSYEQLIEELDNLKKKLLYTEKSDNKGHIEKRILKINDYPTLHRLASGSGVCVIKENKEHELDEYSEPNPEELGANAEFLKVQRENDRLKWELNHLKKKYNDLETDNERTRKRAEKLFRINKQLKSSNADLENFIYSASHDLRSPISNLEGLIHILKNELNNKIGASELTLMQMITASITSFKQTILDLTELSTFQKQAKEAQEPVILTEILDDVKTSIHNKIVESGAEIEMDFKVSEIKFARKNLRSIIFNLLINAVKYRSTRRPLKIKLSARKKGKSILFEIEDNGLGFLPEQREKLFQMFKRLHTHVEGTGVGLYIVKKIVENSGGRIEVESELDKGSKFKIFFKG